MALPCVSPAPTRQLFKTESYGSEFLLIDQRTGMCMQLDSAASSPAGARVLLGACKRNNEANELWSFSKVNIETGEFFLQSKKSSQCLKIGDDKKIAQTGCDVATFFVSKN